MTLAAAIPFIGETSARGVRHACQSSSAGDNTTAEMGDRSLSDENIGSRSVAPCWFAPFAYSTCDFYPRFGPDPAHLIPQQRLKAADLHHLALDLRSWVPGCRKHHYAFDQKIIRLELADYPPEFREFAEENDLYFDGPERGWKVAARKAA